MRPRASQVAKKRLVETEEDVETYAIYYAVRVFGGSHWSRLSTNS